MLKKYSSLIFGISIVSFLLALIGGIALAVQLESFWIFFTVLLCCGVQLVFLLSYSSLLSTVADDETTIWEIARTVKKLQQQLENLTAPGSADAKDAKQAGTPSAKAEAPDQIATVSGPNEIKYITCHNCGEKQRIGRDFCIKCGASFDSSVQDKPVLPQAASDGSIICPCCGQSQRANRTRCYNCGAVFEKQ